MLNYIEDVNRFKLPTPPQWFLKRLYDFDASLVLLPSRRKVKGEAPAYLLCRRTTRRLGAAMLDNLAPDTNMCYVHGVLPIAPLKFHGGTTTFTERGCEMLIKELRSRDTWAVTGGASGDADKLVDAIEANEQRQQNKERRGLRDMFHHMARDAYRSMKARSGQRNKRASDYHGVARAPRTSQRVILTNAT